MMIKTPNNTRFNKIEGLRDESARNKVMKQRQKIVSANCEWTVSKFNKENYNFRKKIKY